MKTCLEAEPRGSKDISTGSQWSAPGVMNLGVEGKEWASGEVATVLAVQRRRLRLSGHKREVCPSLDNSYVHLGRWCTQKSLKKWRTVLRGDCEVKALAHPAEDLGSIPGNY